MPVLMQGSMHCSSVTNSDPATETGKTAEGE